QNPLSANFSDVTSIGIIDDRTIDINLSRPSPKFINVLQFGPLPKHKLIGQHLMNNSFGFHPIGAGPFRLRDLSRSRIDLERNPDYHFGSPRVDELTIYCFEAEQL